MTGGAVDQPSDVTLHGVITRADGTVIDLGQISAHYRNPIRQAWWLLVGKPRAEARIRKANRSAGS